jgi:hypothetical protein
MIMFEKLLMSDMNFFRQEKVLNMENCICWPNFSIPYLKLCLILCFIKKNLKYPTVITGTNFVHYGIYHQHNRYREDTELSI